MPVYEMSELDFICFVDDREIYWQLYFKLNRIIEPSSETQIIRIFHLGNKSK